MFKKRKIDEYKVGEILQEVILDSIEPTDRKIILYPEITKRGIIRIHTNIPGILIGKCRSTLEHITYRMKTEVKAKGVKIVEMKFLSNIKGLY